MQDTLLSVVIPCYNEEESLHALHERISTVCKNLDIWQYEIVLVDDGSSDKTRDIITELSQQDDAVIGVFLSRNHGHQLALTAGLNVAKGARIFIMDADLQDPPEVLPQMMLKMDKGAHVVYGQREKRDGETVFKKLSAKIFYRVLNALCDVPIPVDTGDFRLMSRKALDMLNAMPERHRFIRGMVSWIGLSQEAHIYHRDSRFAGETKYTLRKMIRFALDAITSFSIRPLKIATIFGLGFAVMATLFFVYIAIAAFNGNTVQGWASLITVILFCSSVQLVVLGLIGEYLGRLYLEVKGRPLYVIDHIVGQNHINETGIPEISSEEMDDVIDNEVRFQIHQLEQKLQALRRAS